MARKTPREATKNMVSDFDLAVAAAKAVRLGVVDTEEEFGNIAKVAAKLGLSVGQDLGKSVDDLTVALDGLLCGCIEELRRRVRS